MNKLHETLKQYWGYDQFRPLQEEIILSILSGKDTLGLMPTGGGKSLTFQLPTLMTDGLCLVVTPLVALMKDQVDALRQKKIKAAYVHSGMSRREILTTFDNCIYGQYKFLYVSPERLTTELFLAKLPYLNIRLLTVDESHCISQWGYDFRPPYLKIADIRRRLPAIPVLALTATATPEVIDDIQEKLLFRQKNTLRKSFERKNIAYVIRNTEEKIYEIIRILKKVPGSAIIYVRSRTRTEEIATELRLQGFNATHFHAALTTDEKEKRQNAWKTGQCPIIVCTNAFGMGIDKPDVRLIIHHELPSTLEEYIQESGRAGRDGKKSYAVALYSPSDSRTLKRRISTEFPEREFIRQIYEKLAYYFQIPVGEGSNSGHNFRLEQFCNTRHYNTTQVYNALKILSLSGYIEYIEETEKQSRLKITCTKDELYNCTHLTAETDYLLQTLMRSYTGIFSDYIHIDEELIAQRSRLSRAQVYETLKMLTKQNILHYIPMQQVPTIYYLQDRVETHRIIIPRTVYEQRRERFAYRTGKVIEYCNQHTGCRSKTLMQYFGETNAGNCGICDICLAKRHAETHPTDTAKITATILNLLQSQKLTVEEIIDSTGYSGKQIIETLEFMANSNQVTINGDTIEKKQQKTENRK
jgi:ATP-dependent DNA helicase RecQ